MFHFRMNYEYSVFIIFTHMMEEINSEFVIIATAIGEPSRAKMLQMLLDGKAYTARELAIEAEISATAASNHLNKLLEARILKVEKQGKYRYYTFYNPEVAFAIEALTGIVSLPKESCGMKNKGVRYCRTCYDHLAGEVGVKISDALIDKGILYKSDKDYILTAQGVLWLELLNIGKEDLLNKKRIFARQCLDWSERRFHISGHLPALLLTKMLEKGWFKKIEFSRELFVTVEGKRKLSELLNVNL
jgi:DNA-binding transcriptional ArsR family regulator